MDMEGFMDMEYIQWTQSYGIPVTHAKFRNRWNGQKKRINEILFATFWATDRGKQAGRPP